MEDYSLSRSEYSNLLISKLAPCVYQGLESMFSDTLKMCQENDEEEKYLMTMQNMLSRVPKWNTSIIDSEVERIKKESNCSYIGDLLTCVHVTHMKLLTSVRVGQKKKKMDISIPKLDIFIHDVYTVSARQLYKNVYLFDIDVMPIEKQKYRREIETIIQDSILEVIRKNMPIESILKAYLDETTEHEVYEEVETEPVTEKIIMEKPTEAETETDINFNEPLLTPTPSTCHPVVPESPRKVTFSEPVPESPRKLILSEPVPESPRKVILSEPVPEPSQPFLGATNEVLPVIPPPSINDDDFTIKIDNNNTSIDNIELDIETL